MRHRDELTGCILSPEWALVWSGQGFSVSKMVYAEVAATLCSNAQVPLLF